MLFRVIAALKVMDAAPNKRIETEALLHKTEFSRSELHRIFANLEQIGIVSRTGYTFFGDIAGYELKRALSGIPLRDIVDALATRTEAGPDEPKTEGYRRYRLASDTFRSALAAITLDEF